MRLLLNEEEDFCTREIGRRLDLPSSTVHYHLTRLVNLGILTKEVVDGPVLHAYYTPQPIFTEDIDGTLQLLNAITEKVENGDLVNCIDMFLKCYGND